ncbi:PREDICTED: uncharacterized protein LOC106805383 [Priapulus caudatus]|uniref:Uncharacterized protein LOC106805383 n=1 Tax=Priapulus caudatus TaxID=37621 RepID=A0ABM1DR61_PRICU|nr:PREDICTED: uncharacterized protein LOC106805383 [Priapulus caudatus]
MLKHEKQRASGRTEQLDAKHKANLYNFNHRRSRVQPNIPECRRVQPSRELNYKQRQTNMNSPGLKWSALGKVLLVATLVLLAVTSAMPADDARIHGARAKRQLRNLFCAYANNFISSHHNCMCSGAVMGKRRKRHLFLKITCAAACRYVLYKCEQPLPTTMFPVTAPAR